MITDILVNGFYIVVTTCFGACLLGILLGRINDSIILDAFFISRAIPYLLLIILFIVGGSALMPKIGKCLDDGIEEMRLTKVHDVSLFEVVSNDYLRIIENTRKDSSCIYILYVDKEYNTKKLKATVVSPKNDTIIFKTTLEVFEYLKKYGYETTNTIRKDENNIEYTLQKSLFGF